MTIRGKIKSGKVVLDKAGSMPEGTEVEVRAVKKSRKPKTPTKSKPPLRSLAERLAPFIGAVKDLPPDMSVNLDHYLYGIPKKQ